MKPLIIGEAPSKNEVTERPIEGRVGRRLAACAGLSFGDFLYHFERVNLLHERQETIGKGFTFDTVAARIEADRLRSTFVPDQVVLLLGGRVAEAFGIHDEYFTKHILNKAHAYLVPHPSGVNRWWNEAANVEKANAFMRGIICA